MDIKLCLVDSITEGPTCCVNKVFSFFFFYRNLSTVEAIVVFVAFHKCGTSSIVPLTFTHNGNMQVDR